MVLEKEDVAFPYLQKFAIICLVSGIGGWNYTTAGVNEYS